MARQIFLLCRVCLSESTFGLYTHFDPLGGADNVCQVVRAKQGRAAGFTIFEVYLGTSLDIIHTFFLICDLWSYLVLLRQRVESSLRTPWMEWRELFSLQLLLYSLVLASSCRH